MSRAERAGAVAELERVAPAELLAPRDLELTGVEVRSITRLENEQTEMAEARRALLNHFSRSRRLKHTARIVSRLLEGPRAQSLPTSGTRSPTRSQI